MTTLKIGDVFREIDLLDGFLDNHHYTMNVYKTGLYDTCKAGETIREAAPSTFAPAQIPITTQVQKTDNTVVTVNCASHLAALQKLLEVIRPLIKPLNTALGLAFLRAGADPEHPSFEEVDKAYKKMPEAHKQLFSVQNILEAAIDSLVTVDAKPPVAEAIARELALLKPLSYTPKSWIVGSKIDAKKAYQDIMDVLYTYGIDSTGIVPGTASKGYKPKKIPELSTLESELQKELEKSRKPQPETIPL